MSLQGFGTGTAQLPYRQSMHQSAQTVQTAVYKYINDTATQNAIFETAVKIIHGSNDGQERVRQCVLGAVNYIDYLLNFGNVQAADALTQGIRVCVDGLISNIVLQSNIANQLDSGIRYQLSQAEQQLGVAIGLVNQYIVPEIQKERQGGFGSTQLTGGHQRRTGDSFTGNTGFGSNGAGGVNLLGSAQSNASGLGGGQSSLFSSTAQPPAGTGQGGGLVIDVPVTTPTPLATPSLQQTISNPTAAIKQQPSLLVTYMNYSDHKTFGLLKKVLPSDSNRQLMQEQTLENNFAAMTAVNNYTKLVGPNVQRSDLVLSPGAGYAVETITLSYGQRDFASLVNEEAAETLQLNRKELNRLTFTGLFVQMGPEYIDGARLDEMLKKYTSGMITHGRLTSMFEEMETFLRPETVAIFSRKLTKMATDYWRFEMAQEGGGLSNYFLDHDDVTEYLRREPGMERLGQLWSEFPAYMLGNLFLNVPVRTADDETKNTLGFHVGYIRIPYYATELPIGVNSDESKGFGIVSRTVTPGLYNLCQSVYEAYPGAAHRVIMTNEGRMVNVTRSKVAEKDVYYIQELETVL